MIFNSLEFLFLLLPATLAAFWLAPRSWRMGILLAASLVFYGQSGNKPLLGLVLTILVGWLAAFLLHTRWRRPALLVALGFPLGILFLAKYLGFVWVDIPALFGLNASLESLPDFIRLGFPAGISFYTFQILSYDLDVYNDRLPPDRDLLCFATYIAFFPQLIAGPILRYDQIRDQLKGLREGLPPDLPRGIKYLSIGLFAKIMAADLLAAFTKSVTTRLAAGEAVHLADGLFYLLGYTFRIYYDFWAYSLMAMGLGLLFGLTLPRNFAEPYLSHSPREFWRRWHITLSYWLRDYIYIALGGNRRFYARNILIVFVACGIWHGAGFGFILWGAWHGLLVLGYHTIRPAWDRLPGALAITLTFVLTALAWPLFDLGVDGYGHLLSSLTLEGSPTVSSAKYAFLGLVALLTFLGREDHWLYNAAQVRFFDQPVVHASLFFCALLFLDYGQTFIYFRF